MDKSKKIAPILAAAAFVVVMAAIIIGTFLVNLLTPSEKKADLKKYFSLVEDRDMAVIYNGDIIGNVARYVDNHVYLEYSFVHDYVNERFYWDFNENLLLYTTTTDIVRTEPLTADYYVGNKKVTGDYGEIVKLDGDLVYINLGYVDLYTDLIYSIYENPNRIVMEGTDREYEEASVKKDTQIRIREKIKSDVLKDVTKGEKLEVVEKGDKWVLVRSEDGLVGYVKRKHLGKVNSVKVPLERTIEEFEHRFAEGPIGMLWHQVTNEAANKKVSEIIGKTKGLTVISPTWFYLNDNEGSIASLASKDYVNYCHSQGIEVWALISNLEDSSVDTTEVLTHTTYRENLVNALISKALEYKLDGINLDLEALDPGAGDSYIQLIRELSLKCHANGLTLSVDNYAPTAYTAFYNRSQQALFADYIVIMGYDEHYVGSDAGSVSSIGFVQQAVENTLKEVPANQIILGLPFYTRLWEVATVYNEEGELVSITTDSSVKGMNSAAEVLTNNGVEAVWDDEVGQYYAHFESAGMTYYIWLEEERSLELKLKELKEHELAGVSFWKSGFERDSIWNIIVKYLSN